MNEQELRELVRESIARHTGAAPGHQPAESWPSARSAHASFARLPVVRGADDDGACIIEPSVRCNHCGYCQSYGH